VGSGVEIVGTGTEIGEVVGTPGVGTGVEIVGTGTEIGEVVGTLGVGSGVEIVGAEVEIVGAEVVRSEVGVYLSAPKRLTAGFPNNLPLKAINPGITCRWSFSKKKSITAAIDM